VTGPNALDIRKGSVHPKPVDIPVEESTLPGSQVMEAIGQLVSTIDHDRVARQPVEGTGCSLKDFCSHHSESFDRKGDHISAKNWLNEAEELLATLRSTNEQKVACTAYKLTGEAKCWWQDKKVVLVTDLGSETTISWEVFKHEFNRHFFPRVVQEAKAREFLDLVQGEMSVIEYAAKFLQLLRFGLYLILTEEKKAKKFEQGLNSRIQIMMSCFDIWDFSQLVDKASIYEESLKENAAEYADQKKRTQGTGTSVRGARPAKRMVVGSFPPQRPQGCTSGNPPASSQRNQTSELCKKCNRVHWGLCRMATGTCYRCGQFGHFSKDCVSKGAAQKPLVLARVYALVLGESEGGSEVVTGTIPIPGFEASILFDSGATHSFISVVFVGLSRLVMRTLEPSLAITTPVRKTVVCKRVVCECPVNICGRVLPTNLVVLPMFNYDIILGMDWLTKHSMIIDCVLKQVTLTPWGEEKVTYVGKRARSLPPTISATQVRKLIVGGDQAFLAFIVTPTKQAKKNLEDIPVM
jgi:hypothetical protein